MPETWIVPEINKSFDDSFAQMLINYIYSQWSLTGNLAKPAAMQGQNNLIEFRTGLPSEFKSLAVWTLQGPTQVVEYSQIGQRRVQMHTIVQVTLKAIQLQRDDPDPLTDMENELRRIVGQYKQSNQTDDMAGIKDLIYDGGDREYKATDTFDKSDWRSMERVRMWYEQVDIS